MDTLALQLALIFLPGIIWARMDYIFASRRKPNQFNFLLNAFMFGVFTYAITWLVYRSLSIEFGIPNFSNTADPKALSGFADEILSSSVAALILSVIWCATVKKRLLMRGMLALGASKSFGDEDVWEFTFNSDGDASKYVDIRDISNNRIYSGFVYAWSGSDQLREVLLVDVRVYEETTANFLYEMPQVYLEYRERWLAIEYPTGLKE